MKSKRRKRRRIPIVLILITVLSAASILVANQFRDQLSDSLLQFDFAVARIATAACFMVLATLWLCWLWFFSGLSRFWSRLVPAGVALLGIGFLVLYQPKMKGGMNWDRWEPRFWSVRRISFDAENRLANLADTTQYDFPQFMGPSRDGVIGNFAVPLQAIDRQASIVWKKPIGEGWSGFVAVNGFAITMQQNGGDEVIACYDVKTGQVQWTYRYQRRHEDVLGGVGPRSTPTVDDGKVYAMGATGMLVCLDGNSGELVWKQDLTELLDITLAETRSSSGIPIQTEDTTVTWGRSGSPLVHEDIVIVPGGGPRGGAQASLIAFDKQTGEEKWRGGDDGISYSSPCVATLAGMTQIVSVNEATVSGHNPETGEQLWEYERPGNSDAGANTSQATLAGNDRILVSKGYGMGGELLKIKRDQGGQYSVASLWKNQRVLKTKLTNPVISQGYVYALSDGILECVDLETGRRMWKKGRYEHGQLLVVGDKLLIHAETGYLVLVDASEKDLIERGRFDTIDGICWNTLCVYNQYVLLRSELEAACVLIEPMAD